MIAWSPPGSPPPSTLDLVYSINVERVNKQQDSGYPEKPKDQTYTTTLNKHEVPDLIPGGHYRIVLNTILKNTTSRNHIVTILTVPPNPIGKNLVWFRSQTTLLFLWQPPNPAGLYSGYQVSIDPEDAREALVCPREVTGPASAAFKGLVPGREYTRNVWTVTEDLVLSEPTSFLMRTVPSRPSRCESRRTSNQSSEHQVEWPR